MQRQHQVVEAIDIGQSRANLLQFSDLPECIVEAIARQIVTGDAFLKQIPGCEGCLALCSFESIVPNQS
jgi:hypothetical protein